MTRASKEQQEQQAREFWARVVSNQQDADRDRADLGLVLDWDNLPIAARRSLLRVADLWDGNTYAARTWAELPVHIQADINAAWEGQRNG